MLQPARGKLFVRHIDTAETLPNGRILLTQKTREDLVLPVSSAARLNIGALQLGYIREIARGRWATLGLGGSATLNVVPQSLEAAYGSRTPIGTFVFLRLRPFHVIANGMSK